MSGKWKLIIDLVGIAVILATILIQSGRILERLDHVEQLADDYGANVMMQGTVTRAEFQLLRDIHVRAGDIQ